MGVEREDLSFYVLLLTVLLPDPVRGSWNDWLGEEVGVSERVI